MIYDGDPLTSGPNEIERTFLIFFRDLYDARPTMRRAFRAAIATMQYRDAHRDGAPPIAIGAIYASSPFGRAQAAAQNEAGAVLIPTEALIEDMFARFEVEKSNYSVGPAFNGIPLTDLIWAGANSARHGREWNRLWSADMIKTVMASLKGDEIESGRLFEHRSWQSIWRLRAALAAEPFQHMDNHAADILFKISDGGDFEVYFHRVLAVGTAFASLSAGHKLALDRAAEFFDHINRST